MKKHPTKINVKKFFFALIYGISSGVAINCFLTPNALYTGGITGLSQLFFAITKELAGVNIPIWIWILIFNIPLAVLSMFWLGKRFTVFSFVSIVISSAAIKLIPVCAVTDEPILAAVFGGVIIGFGTGLCFRAGFSTGGVDFIIFFIRKKTGQTVGQLGLFLNGCIAAAVGLLYGVELALYSLIAIFISNKLLNFFYVQQHKVTISIFTEEREKMIKTLGRYSIHGVSYIENVFGGYTNKKIELIVSVVSQHELLLLKDVIPRADPRAFVNIQPTNEVIGFFKKENI